MSVPRGPGGSPATYLAPTLGRAGGISSADPTPAFPFGHGLGYTTVEYSGLEVSATSWPTGGELRVSCTVRNTGGRDGAEVVQLYLSDPVASVVQPVRRLVGFARVELAAGAAARVSFRLHADRASFTGRDLRRVVEAGEVALAVGASSEDLRLRATVHLTGPDRVVGVERVLTTPVTVEPLG